MCARTGIRGGLRAGLPLVLPTLTLGVSFGVLAKPVMGPWAPIVMSASTFSGGAQFASVGVLSAGGTAAAAVGAGLLMNARWVPMSLALAPSLDGHAARRSLQAQAIVDASFVLANRGDGRFDRGVLVGATLAQASAWVSGTILGVLAGDAFPQPERFGLDAVFPAFYLALLAQEFRIRRCGAVIAGAVVVTAVALPFAPPGVPIIAAAAAALMGLRGPT